MAPIKTAKDFIAAVHNRQFPISCHFELTYQCNLHCIHCYIVRKKTAELTTREIITYLKQLKNVGCLHLIFTGGEPFLRKDIFEILEHARSLDFDIRIFTNGTLIDKRAAIKIRKIVPSAVEISLYGLKNTHEKITRMQGSFAKTINAIAKLIEMGVNVLVKTTVLQYNVHELWKLRQFVKHTLKAQFLDSKGLYRIFPCDDASTGPLHHALSDLQMKHYIEDGLYRHQPMRSSNKLLNIDPNLPLCGAGRRVSNITPYGQLNPCVRLRFNNGNSLKRASFIRIWRDNKLFKSLRASRMRDRKHCRGCPSLSYCSYCPSYTYFETGSFLTTSSELCRQARIQKEVYEKWSQKHGENRTSSLSVQKI